MLPATMAAPFDGGRGRDISGSFLIAPPLGDDGSEVVRHQRSRKWSFKSVSASQDVGQNGAAPVVENLLPLCLQSGPSPGNTTGTHLDSQRARGLCAHLWSLC